MLFNNYLSYYKKIIFKNDLDFYKNEVFSQTFSDKLSQEIADDINKKTNLYSDFLSKIKNKTNQFTAKDFQEAFAIKIKGI